MGRLSRLLLRVMVAFAAAAAVSALPALLVRRRALRITDPAADEIALVSIFESLAFRSRAAAFRGGSVTCWYGGGTIDLRGATLAPQGATLHLRALFGGGQLIVPADWRVRIRVVPLLGGIGDARPRLDRGSEAPVLTLEGVTCLGGFAVMSELPESGEAWLSERVDAAAPATRNEPVSG